MNYTNISLTTPKGICLALQNAFENVMAVEDAVEDSINGEDLVAHIRAVPSYIKKVELDKENDKKIRLKLTAYMCNNVEYLTVYKS